MDRVTKHAIDAGAVTILGMSLADWLPPVAAALTIIWTLIRIWETDTVQKWRSRLKTSKK